MDYNYKHMVQKKDRKARKQKAGIRKAQKSKKLSKKSVTNRATPSVTKELKKSPLPPVVPKPDSFLSFKEVVSYAKSCVYHITRIRQAGANNIEQYPLGTGYLIGKNRMMTCSHCIFNTQTPDNPGAHHQDGDVYLFVNRDENGYCHTAYLEPKINENLFTFPNIDGAIFYLPDGFYKHNGDWIMNPAQHLSFKAIPLDIGSKAGVLGYPLQGLVIMPDGTPTVSQIYLRGDYGVVNTRHHTDVFQYEFTMAFNPGNSGGPIFDIESGLVIGMVHGYRTYPIGTLPMTLPSQDPLERPAAVIVPLTTTYSIGFAAVNYQQLKDKHGLSFADVMD